MTKRLSNDALDQLAVTYLEHKTAEAIAKAAKENVRDEILDELKRRKVNVGDHADVASWRILHKAKKTKVWSVEQVKARFARKLHSQLLRVTVDGPALEFLAKQGMVSADDVAACLERTDVSASYIDIQVLDKAA